jgi:2-polyprenyl-3-methyl-5-hydroxy-6-metoxy-1,4-benzoquinol methylase
MARLRRLGWAWDRLGRDNALGAILTKDGQVTQWTLDDFLASGRADAAKFMASLQRIAPAAPRRRALDFGCGVGRLTRALADHFQAIVGMDVAPSMVEQARSLHADCSRCTFTLNRSTRLDGVQDGAFDVVYCRLVLQHIRPVLVRQYIPELIRVVAPGGVLMFQLPEVIAVDPLEAFEKAPVVGGALKRNVPRPILVAWRRLKYLMVAPDPGAKMDMFGVDRSEVEALVQRSGGRLLAVEPDDGHGQIGRGFAYWVTRA